MNTAIDKAHLAQFSNQQLNTINNSAAMAEELVSNHYKMSASQWLRRRYDFKTLADLSSGEIVQGPFAQIIRYVGHKQDAPLSSTTYDFYKICLQDHCIIGALETSPIIELHPFSLYITTHELIHIVRFSKFLCNFEATEEEKMIEEAWVHRRTREILAPLTTPGLPAVLNFYEKWRIPLDELETF
ncbi:MAG: hypothetical protein JRH15_07265 [Deltaproteobacteria bacterium]|nr:hypothetical protein [Deltaproteobacteria bacterium]